MSGYICVFKNVSSDSYSFTVTEEPREDAFICEHTDYANSHLVRILSLLKNKKFNFKGISFLKDCQIRLQVYQVIIGSSYTADSNDALWTSELKQAIATGTSTSAFHYLAPMSKFRKIRCEWGTNKLQSWTGSQWVNDDIITRLCQISVSGGNQSLADQIHADRDDLICMLTGHQVSKHSNFSPLLALIPVLGLTYVLTSLYSN